MIEVLVALLLLSVGFLGVMGMQVAAKRANFAAVQRTSALVLAHDMGERLRANPQGLQDYLTAGVGGGSLTEPLAGCSRARPCSVGDMAVWDLYEWQQALDGVAEQRAVAGVDTAVGGLLDPRGCISGPAGGGAGLYQVTVVWRGLPWVGGETGGGVGRSSDTDCGSGLNLYGEDEQLRQVFSLTLFITP